MIVDIKMEERIPQTWTLTEPRDNKISQRLPRQQHQNDQRTHSALM